MGRTKAFESFTRIVRIADFCRNRGLPAEEGRERAAEWARVHGGVMSSRRHFLKRRAGMAAIGMPAPMAGTLRLALAAQAPSSNLQIGIVGAGLAGLVCADELHKNGIAAQLFDAGTRTGGRCWSLRGYFPGQ